MTLELWVHLAHILGAVIWVGGGVILSVVGARVRQSDDIHIIRDFARMLSYVGLRVFTPSVVTVIVSGIWLVFLNSEEFKFTIVGTTRAWGVRCRFPYRCDIPEPNWD
jgi:uncharacterized membrane protein